MAQLEPRTWMEILSTSECWRLLGTCAVGRLAVTGDDGPEIYPVNIAVDGESVVFRTDPGSKVTAIAADPRVALEVDSIDLEAQDGWSVVVAGRLVELNDGELVAARRLPLAPWTIGDKQRWFRLVPRRITGRGIGVRASRARPPAAR
jgi:nitroimidazol reductase NimA-like FMN-containing flavoprotein (pyridoxamine 5'-phosphate oxidase superfamily)